MTVRAQSRPVIEFVAGARPNFVKLAPVVQAVGRISSLAFRIVHTGQHYDSSMSDVFFEELAIPQPAVHLGVGSAPHGAQTGRILEQYEAHLLAHRPAATVVFGDVNSTIACALAAVKLGVPVAHVEAGLRSFDRTMPEEINRIVTDSVADLLLVSEPAGIANLEREGIPHEKVRLVGNVMIDSLMAHLPAARQKNVPATLGVAGRPYGFVTLHRPSNVDDPIVLQSLLTMFRRCADQLPLVFAVHPRTAAAAARFGCADLIRPGHFPWICVPPLSYVDAISLVAGATLVVTDSGGLQEETSVLRVPCLTLRDTTERPITVERGTSRLLAHDVPAIEAAFDDVLKQRWPAGDDIPLWDGHAADRVARELACWLGVAD